MLGRRYNTNRTGWYYLLQPTLAQPASFHFGGHKNNREGETRGSQSLACLAIDGGEVWQAWQSPRRMQVPFPAEIQRRTNQKDLDESEIATSC